MNNQEKKDHSLKCSSFCRHVILSDEPGCQYEHTCDCDGYHTFTELYEHRIELFITLCRTIQQRTGQDITWRSQDGIYNGWFILGIRKKEGEKQITYHIPDSRWQDCNFAETLEHPPKWDGHTSDDVLERLKHL